VYNKASGQTAAISHAPAFWPSEMRWRWPWARCGSKKI